MGECWWEWGAGKKAIKRRKTWKNCNSIINKIYFKIFNIYVCVYASKYIIYIYIYIYINKCLAKKKEYRKNIF